MPVFLDEEMMGRDTTLVGFPHVLLCMAFVARTNNDLWGVHMIWPGQSPATFAAFWQWAQGKGLQTAAITDIFGCCNREVRYAGAAGRRAAWTAEMQWFGAHLGWNGPAHGFDTGVIAPLQGTYIEYQRAFVPPCRILYKRHEKTADTGSSPPVADSPLNDIRSTALTPVCTRPWFLQNRAW